MTLRTESLQTDAKIFRKKLLLAKEEKREKIHSFHRYFGKLIPAIPRFAIQEFTDPDDTVCDIMCGTGTTLVEAMLSDRNSYGIDINPLPVLISKVKTTLIDKSVLEREKIMLLENIKDDGGIDFQNDLPFCVNMDHWFKPFVQKDLVIIKRNIDIIEDRDIKDFFLTCFSAFLRGVSNADTRHIFPGYSKWLREQDRNGHRHIDVMTSFEKVVNNRIAWLSEFSEKTSPDITANVIRGDAREIPKGIGKVDLIVTNVPYISSIRYLETMKLEMFWLGYLLSSKEYSNFDKFLVGTERFASDEIREYQTNGLEEVDKITRMLFDGEQQKMSKVVHKYFVDMEKSFEQMYRILRSGGHIVMKISDSYVRGFTVPTHEVFIKMAKNLGLEVRATFEDEILNRSLLLQRNSYSGIIAHDWILVFKK